VDYAWDFETEPEFEEQLVWMRGFMREEIMPSNTGPQPRPGAGVHQPCKTRCASAASAAHLPQELAHGIRQVRLDSCTRYSANALRPVVFGKTRPTAATPNCCGGMEMTGDAQEYVRERWLQPLLDGTIRSASR